MAGQGAQWSQDKGAITVRLEMVENDVERNSGDLAHIKTEVALLKLQMQLKSAAWGAIGGAVLTMLSLAIFFLKGK